MQQAPAHAAPLIGITGDDPQKVAEVSCLFRDRFEVATVAGVGEAACAFRYVRAVVLLRSTRSRTYARAFNRALIPAPFVHVWTGAPSASDVYPPIDLSVALQHSRRLLVARLLALLDTPPARLFGHAFSRHPDIHPRLKLAVGAACGGDRMTTTVAGLAVRLGVSRVSINRWWRASQICDSLGFGDLVRFIALLRGLAGDDMGGAPPPMDRRTYRKAATELLGVSGDQLPLLSPAYALQLFLERHCWQERSD